jgi:hypothetical protein
MIVRPLPFELGGTSRSEQRERQGAQAAKNSIAWAKMATLASSPGQVQHHEPVEM